MQKNPAVNLTVLSAPASTADNKQKLSCQHSNGVVFNLHLGQQSAKVPVGFQGQYDFEIWEFEIPKSNGKKIWCGSLIPGASQNQPIAPQTARLAPQQAPQGLSQPAEKPNDEEKVDWNAKDLRNARMNSLNNATLFITKLAEVTQNATWLSREQISKVANSFVDYIYNGLMPTNKYSQEPEADNAQAGGEPQNVRDMPEDQVPFN